jgi:uncharacterized protein
MIDGDQYVQPPLPSQPVPFIERYGISPVLFAFTTLILVFILYQIVGGVITILIFGYTPTAHNLFGFRLATGIGQIVFLLLPTILLTRLATFQPREYLRLIKPNLRSVLVSLVGIFSLQQMLQIYMVAQDRIPFPEPVLRQMSEFKQIIEEMYKQLVSSQSIPELLWVILVVALIPAVAEELLFRGLVQRSFERGLTPMRGVLITGIIFGAYHLNPFSFVPLAALGMYLGYITMRTGSIVTSMVGHCYNNLFASIALYMNLSDDYVVAGNANEMSLLALLVTFWFFGVVFLITLYYFNLITKQQSEEPPSLEGQSSDRV